MDKEELLPCPFCGGKPSRYESDYGELYGIGCDNEEICGVLPSTDNCVIEKDAIAAWNRRA